MTDLATEIFSGVGDAVAELNKTATEGDISDSTGDDVTNNSNQQDVDTTQSQGDKPPASSDKSAESKTEDEEAESGKAPKPKVDGAAQVRKWGEQHKAEAERLKTELDGHQPTLKLIDERFGGIENLNFAADIYGAITAEKFDPEDALKFLEENAPEVADSLVTYIAKDVIQRATDNAIKRTFGRELSADEVTSVTSFLASGKKSGVDYERFLANGNDIPEELLRDADGNELPQATVDWMRQQYLQNKQHEAKLSSIEGRINNQEQQQREAKAAAAVEEYVADQFSVIETRIAKLGLDKAYEGETPELKAIREQAAEAIEALVMWRAGKDEAFQAMYNKALVNQAKSAVNTKDRAAKSTAVDSSRRIKAKIEGFIDGAADFVSPLLEQIASSRKAQVDKTKTAKGDLDAPTADAPKKERDETADPFDKAAILAEVGEKQRAGAFKSR